MFKRTLLSATLALASPFAAHGATDGELSQIRQEIAQMKQAYEARIATLEARLEKAEAADAKKEQATAQAASQPAPAPATSVGAFNPGISLILSGIYSNHSHDPAGYQITGFHLPNDAMGDIKPQRGFSLAESELGIYANIDPHFAGGLNFAIHPDNTVSTEEAFIQTLGLSQGLTIKAGRFFSGIGYINEQHAHTWDFVDTPLAYQAFLGGQFNNDGVQMRWIAPTDTFLEIGAELGRGANYPGTGRDKNGSGASALYAHLGGDAGSSNSWRGGVSLLTTSPQGRQWDGASAMVTNSFSGNSKLWIADAVWKWAPNGNPYYTNFKLQGEYLRRVEDGSLVYDLNAAAVPGSYSATQSGWYLQGIYQFAPYWRVGLRTERLDSGSVDYGDNNSALTRPSFRPARQSLMVDYNPSEFSRIRLQFAQDKSTQDVTDNQIFLQYQMSLGAHGAHKY